jgi:hypothetical protein
MIDLDEVLQHAPGEHPTILRDPRSRVRAGHRRHAVSFLLFPAASALIQRQVPIWEKFSETLAHEENPEFMNLKSAGSTDTELRKLHVGFEGQMGTHVRGALLRL